MNINIKIVYQYILLLFFCKNCGCLKEGWLCLPVSMRCCKRIDSTSWLLSRSREWFKFVFEIEDTEDCSYLLECTLK